MFSGLVKAETRVDPEQIRYIDTLRYQRHLMCPYCEHQQVACARSQRGHRAAQDAQDRCQKRCQDTKRIQMLYTFASNEINSLPALEACI